MKISTLVIYIVDRLMDLDEHAMNHNLDRRWIEDFSMLHCNETMMKLARSAVKKKKVTFATDLSGSSTNKSDFRKKLEEETLKLLCERNCVKCFKQERFVLIVLCVLHVMYPLKRHLVPFVIKK